MCTCVCVRVHICVVCVCVRACLRACVRVRVYVRTHTHTHTHKCARIHTYTHVQRRSQLVLSSPEFGCPVNCKTSRAYTDAIAALPCQDSPQGSPALQEWANEVARASRQWPANWADGAASNSERIAALGCSHVLSTRIWGNDFCVPGGSFFPVKPLSHLCPVTCGCAAALRAGREQWGCPLSCGSGSDLLLAGPHNASSRNSSGSA